MKNLRKHSELPYWDDLITDPSIDESIRDALEDCDYEPLKDKKRTHKAIERLSEYRKWRLLSKIGREAEKALTSTEEANIDEVFASVSGILNQQSAGKNFSVLRIGKNSNSMKYVEKILAGTAVTYIPTGFTGFDSVNRGFPPGFILLASPTGRGKSTMISAMSDNMAMGGASVGVAPLEMSNIENLQRNVARVGQIDMTKLLDPQNKLKRSDHDEIREKWLKHDRKIAKNGGKLEFYEFDGSVTIESLLATVDPFELDVLFIDYLGLLDETSGDNQWQRLGDAAWQCHIWATKHKRRVIAAAQMSEEGALRYSKMLAEHAKFFWYWNPDETARANGIYQITQRKARQASDHDFYLQFDLAKMTVKDASKESVEEQKKEYKDKKTPRDGKKVSKKWEEESSVGWGDENDDIPDPVPGKRASHDVKKAGKRKVPRKDIEL